MQHELFQSKLKHSADGALLSGIIRSSSSGQNSHRTAAMELIFEKSIHASRERAFTKVEDSLRPDPTPRSMRACEGPSISILQVQSPIPFTALQPPPQSPNDTSIAPASAKYEASQNSQTLSKPAKRTKVTRREEPPAGAKVSASLSKDAVQVVRWKCNVEQSRSNLRHGVYCGRCRLAWTPSSLRT